MPPPQSLKDDRLSNKAKWALLGGLAVLSCVLMLLLAEAAVRLRATLKYGTTATAEDLYTTDTRYNLRVPISHLRKGRIQTNSLGFRGPEISVPKPDGTIRIAFLGASTTWCAEVSANDKVWPHLVTEKLRKSWPGRQVDYVNGGVPGYTMAASIKNLEYRIAPLTPDVIVIYDATNDMSGELRDLAFAQGILETPSFKPLHWPAKYSLLWELVEKNWRILVAQRSADANAARLDLDVPRLGEPYRKDLTALIVAAKKRAAVVAVATFATQLRVGQTHEQQRIASQSAMFYMPFMTPESLLRSYARYNQVIREVAAETGAILIDDLDAIPGSPDYFTDTVHFTDAGSRAMADRVTSALAPIPLDRLINHAGQTDP
jgi:lysophospholipase L1-like esterase